LIAALLTMLAMGCLALLRLLPLAAFLPTIAKGQRCDDSWCTSPRECTGTSVCAGQDCFAGSESEPCTCRKGEAVMQYSKYSRDEGVSGELTEDRNGDYKYTCCEEGAPEAFAKPRVGELISKRAPHRRRAKSVSGDRKRGISRCGESGQAISNVWATIIAWVFTFVFFACCITSCVCCCRKQGVCCFAQSDGHVHRQGSFRSGYGCPVVQAGVVLGQPKQAVVQTKAVNAHTQHRVSRSCL